MILEGAAYTCWPGMGFQREDQWPRRGHWLGFPAPHPGLCPPPPLPSGPTGQTCLLLLITIAASPPRARLAQERSLPSGALSEDVTGLTICLPNRQGVGVGRGSPQPELCPPPGRLPTFPCSCWAVLLAARRASAGVPPGPHLPLLAEEARVQREGQGQQRGGAWPPPTFQVGQLPGPGPPSTSGF